MSAIETKVEKQAKRRREGRAVAAKRKHAALIEERDQLAALCAAWRELAQARGRRIVADRNDDHLAASLAGGEATEARRKLRKLGIPEEQLR